MGAPPDIDTALAWRGRTVCDRDGDELGTLSALYLDNETRLPAWAGVKRGRLRKSETIVPLGDATEVGDALQIPYDRAQFDDAPDIDPDVALTAEEERRLHEHYGREWSAPSDDEPDAAMSARSDDEPDAAMSARSDDEPDAAMSARSDDEPDAAMTRSEE